MKKINPETLLNRLRKAKVDTPKLVKKSLEESNLDDITRDNLKHGKVGLLYDMPTYSMSQKWKWYGDMKVQRNPLNQRRYDLNLTGKLWSGLDYKVDNSATIVEFFNRNADAYIQQYQGYFGIDEKQLYEVQIRNKPKVRQELEKIISGV